MTEYWIGTGSPVKGSNCLQDTVNEKLAQGWQLHGGLCWDSSQSMVMQAMTREIKVEEPVTGKRAIDLK